MIASTISPAERQAPSVTGRFFEELPALACLIDPEGRVNRVNEAWLELLGYTAGAVVGRPFAKFFHGEDIPIIETGLVRCGPCETWDRFEARFRCQDGSYKWLLWQFKSDSETRFVYAVALDLSDRKVEEAAAIRRLTAATLQAQVWAAFTKGCSTSQAVQAWADSVQRHLAAREVRIWAAGPSQPKPVLQARSIQPLAAGEPIAEFDFLEQYVRQVFASRTPMVIARVESQARLAAHLDLLRDKNIRGMAFYPVVSQDQVVAVTGVFFSTDCEAAENFLLDAVTREMGTAWSYLTAGEDLRATKRTYDALFRSATVGICRVDAGGNVKAWNSAAEKILGWRSSEILTRRFPVAGTAERELFQTCLQGAFEGRSTTRIELKCWSSSGKPVDVAVSISPLSDAEGLIAQAMAVFEDLTDRKRASRCLHLHCTIADTLAGATSINDSLESVLATICEEFEWECGEFWQWDKADETFKQTATWHSAAPNAAKFAAESQRRAASSETAFLQQILQNGKPAHLPGCIRNHQVPRSDLAARCGLEDAIAFPVVAGRDATGVLFFFGHTIERPDEQFLTLMTGISDQVGQFLNRFRMEESLHEAEENLQQAKKMDAIGRLVGGVVHDFNNVLTVILGCGEIVLQESGQNSAAKDLLGEVINAGKRASGLTRQLLSFCRKETAQPVVLDLNATVSEMEKMLRRLIGEHIELQTVLASDLRRLSADPGHLEQVIMNLLVNARDAMPQGGRIVISTQSVELDANWRKLFPGAHPGRYALLSVSDTGSGMDEATKNRIFEPFFTTKPAGKGTGMGLSTVCEIVRESGGQIAVESQPGKGTTFRLLFPTVAQGLTSWQVDAAPATISRGTETVLVVEDDPNVRRLIVRILANQGYTVLEAAGSREAIDLCRADSRRPDLLISDIVMPRMNGHELAVQMKQQFGGLKILFVSGYGDGEHRRSAALGPETPFLQKPFTTYDLSRKVREICDS
jgi:PAS domain S-box-containing protein